jgi:RNA polymerase sigma-70 factor (ECF subfamily)
MTTDAAEGWAHYLGSLLVDAVYAGEGPDLWPDRYDYRDDGMKRLRTQGAKAKGPLAWHQLKRIVGDQGIAPIFRAWGKTHFDPADPAANLGAALKAVSNDDETARWWEQSTELLVLRRAKSAVTAETADEKKVNGPPRELANDDGHAAGKASFAGGGHAVRFVAPDDSCYLTEVRIHGSRYGYPAPPKEDFQVWLCDDEFKQIAKFSYPYAKFQKGNARWVALKTKPTRVPKNFIVCVGFNPTATKGVFVSRDGQASGKSLSGLPGEKAFPFDKGNWMIRVMLAGEGTSASTK